MMTLTLTLAASGFVFHHWISDNIKIVSFVTVCYSHRSKNINTDITLKFVKIQLCQSVICKLCFSALTTISFFGVWTY